MSTQLSRPGRPADRPVPVLTALLVMTIALGVLWLSELVDQLSGNRLDELGIHARELDGLPEIYSAPLLHAGWEHLIANSGPFFVLGLLVLLGGALRWAVATLVSVTASGLTAWLLTPLGTIVLGASGLIFGWLTYLVVRGLLTRRPGQVLLGDRRAGRLRRNDLGRTARRRRHLLAGPSGWCDRWRSRRSAAPPSTGRSADPRVRRSRLSPEPGPSRPLRRPGRRRRSGGRRAARPAGRAQRSGRRPRCG